MSAVCAGSAFGADLVRLPIFRSADAVRDHIKVTVYGHRYAVSPVSAGFLCVPADPACRPVAAAALTMGRPVALTGGTPDALTSAGAGLAAETGGWLLHSGSADDAVCFVVPSAFIGTRLAALRRRQRPPACPPAIHRQRVTAIGVGPRWFTAPAAVGAILARTEAMIATDWTVRYTLPRLNEGNWPPCYTVPYQIYDYDATITGVNAMLDRLRARRVREVALLVEGNPDTYDVLDGVCLAGRQLRLLPGVPIALTAAVELGDALADNPFLGRLAYLSGMPGRHDQTSAEFFRELCCYIDAGISCVLVEMTCGELRLAVQAVTTAAAPRTLVLLMDAYSPAERQFTASTGSVRQVRRLLELGRGKLTTLLIFGEPDAHRR